MITIIQPTYSELSFEKMSPPPSFLICINGKKGPNSTLIRELINKNGGNLSGWIRSCSWEPKFWILKLPPSAYDVSQHTKKIFIDNK